MLALFASALIACGGDAGSTDPSLMGAGTGAAGMTVVGGAPATAGASPGAAGALATAGRAATGAAGGGVASAAGSGASGASAAGGSRASSGAGGAAAGMGAVAGMGAAAGMGASAGSGGAAGMIAAAGSGGDAGFKPCPATGDCKILPLGDSITFGIGSAGGYRVELFHLAVMNMKKITFVGTSPAGANGPAMVDGQPFPNKHEGTSGITIGGLDGRVPSPALGDDPHIILLHIGTNDMYMSTAGAPDRLGTLIDQILMDLPNSLLVVSNIIPYPGAASAVSTYNAAVPGVVKMRADAGKHILFVDQFEGFPTSELGDGIHPNAAGYKRMAAKWWAAIASYMN